MVKYNLYFGEEAVEYYQPATPETELQTLIDDPDEFKKFKKDHEDDINLLTTERDALATERDKEKAEKETLTDELADEKHNRDTEKKTLEAEILKLDTANKVIEADNKKLQKAVNERNAKIAGMVNKADYDAKAQEAANAITALGNKTTEYNVLDGLVNTLKNKWSVANLNALDTKMERYWHERNAERKKINDARPFIKSVADKINSWKTILKGKKEAKADLNRIALIFGYSGSVLGINDDSDEE